MADGRFFEPYHVPQQSRRDKLRVISSSSHNQFPLQIQGCSSSAGSVSIFDPTLTSTDLLTCAAGPGLHNQNPDAKEEGTDFMGFIGGGFLMGAPSSSSSATNSHLYMDPVSSVQLNHSPILDISGGNTTPFCYNPQTPSGLRFLEQSFHGGNEVMGYRPESVSVVHDSGGGNKYGGQDLSLSLSSSHHHSQVHQTTALPLELNLQRYGSSSMYSSKVNGAFPGCGYDGSTSNELLCSRSSVPLGPFTGYASILRGSIFLKPAHQLLEEICGMGRGVYAEKMIELGDDSNLLDPSMECFDGNDDDSRGCRNGVEIENRKKKSRLISMLNEVYKRYRQYYQQMQAVVSSFESVPGVRNAAPFASLALKALSKHFRCLKDAITEQLHLMISNNKHRDSSGFNNPGSGICYPRAPQNTSIMEHHQPVWRPQRGLPERAVAVLRSWLFEHFLHPYPTDTDKILLAKQTGLSRNQVSNWFINARVRLWKPMVEEIHMLETRQVDKGSERGQVDQTGGDGQQHPIPSSSSAPITSEDASTTLTRRSGDQLGSKRTRNDSTVISSGNENVTNLCYQSSSPSFGTKAGGSGGVSLALGLYQKNQNGNNTGFPDPYPINAARRFGLDGNRDAYAAGGGVVAENRQFGREIVGDGQLVHDFVG